MGLKWVAGLWAPLMMLLSGGRRLAAVHGRLNIEDEDDEHDAVQYDGDEDRGDEEEWRSWRFSWVVCQKQPKTLIQVMHLCMNADFARIA